MSYEPEISCSTEIQSNMSDTEASPKKIRPFLKWAGGKYQLIETIRLSLPSGTRLIEPFTGAGSVFLNTHYDNYLLADINKDLIECFHWLQKEKQTFIDYCRVFFQAQYNKKDSFLSLRSEFNTTQDKRLKAALFIYLNRHCFNGLMRYNQEGVFNTSFGEYKKPYFPENEMLGFVTKAQSAEIICANYIQTMEKAVIGDVVYCDPPYVPLSITASFTNYHSSGFGRIEQEHLMSMARELAKKGIPVIISNHDTDFVQNLYAGAKIISFQVQRNISCDGNKRGKAPELLAVFD